MRTGDFYVDVVVIPKSRHQHVIRSPTSVFPSIPNCEARTLVQISILYMEFKHHLFPLVKKWYLLQHRLNSIGRKWLHLLYPLIKARFFP